MRVYVTCRHYNNAFPLPCDMSKVEIIERKSKECPDRKATEPNFICGIDGLKCDSFTRFATHSLKELDNILKSDRPWKAKLYRVGDEFIVHEVRERDAVED